MSTTRLPILAANESHDINGEIIIWWTNVRADKDGLKHLFLIVDVDATDSRNIRHEIQYQLVVVPLSPTQFVTDAIAPGVMLYNRTVKSTPLWRRRFSAVPRRVFARALKLVKPGS